MKTLRDYLVPATDFTVIAVISFFLGLILALIGKWIGGDWQYVLPVIPLASSLMFGNIISELYGYIFFGTGVACAYHQEIYHALF